MLEHPYDLVKVEEAQRLLGETLREADNSLYRREDMAVPRYYLPCPLDPSLITIIWNNFDVKRHTVHGWYAHNGVDFAAPEGTPLGALARSVVTKVQYSNRPWGNRVFLKIIEGPHRGKHYGYCHCKDIAKLKRGEEVEPGAVVAWVGSSGNSTGPHVHLMIRDRVIGFTGYHARPEDTHSSGYYNALDLLDMRRSVFEIAA